MKRQYYITIMGVGINIDRMEYEKRFNTIWFYNGNELIFNISLTHYVIKHTFNSTDEELGKVQYFTILRRER